MGTEPFEGIIETDRWFGPLITNIRLTKTDVPINFSAESPLLQVQPIPRHVYNDATLNNYELVPNLEQLTPEDWDDYYDTSCSPTRTGDAAAGPICCGGAQTPRCRAWQ